MTVRQLIDILSKLDGDMEVVVPTDNKTHLFGTNRVELVGVINNENKKSRLFITKFNSFFNKNISHLIDKSEICFINRGSKIRYIDKKFFKNI